MDYMDYQEAFDHLLTSKWTGATTSQIVEQAGRTRVNSYARSKINAMACEDEYEVYYVRSGNSREKAYRKKFDQYEFGILGIWSLVEINRSQSWISIEELQDVIVRKNIIFEIEDLIEVLENLKEHNFIVEDENTLFFRMRRE